MPSFYCLHWRVSEILRRARGPCHWEPPVPAQVDPARGGPGSGKAVAKDVPDGPRQNRRGKNGKTERFLFIIKSSFVCADPEINQAPNLFMLSFYSIIVCVFPSSFSFPFFSSSFIIIIILLIIITIIIIYNHIYLFSTL